MKSLTQIFSELQLGPWETTPTDVNYRFVVDNSTLYIYFQGSSSVTDWIRNFLFFKRPYKDMEIPYYVHGGFLEAWKEVEDIIISKITERNTETGAFLYSSIIVAGYSHGGALSGLCHECVWFHRPDIRDQIYGFGFESPRFYHGLWVKASLRERWANYTVIRCNQDLVTHCPPILFLFTHVGSLLHIHGDTKLVEGHLPPCIKSHFPQVVLDGLKKLEVE